MVAAPLRVRYVPEHFSTPLYFAKKHFGLNAELTPFPSGTGHMITALRAGEIDVGIGLTEGWVAGLSKEDVEGDGGYRLIGTYVETPLCWAISSGFDRTDIGSVADLKGGTIGVSRLGSGSYVMGFVLADQQGWLSSSTADTRPYPNTAILHTFGNLRKAVNSGEADFFMWEHFTSKRYYDSQEIKRVGEIYTPWSSWKIVTLTSLAGSDGKLDSRVDDLFSKLDQGIKHFNENKDDIVGRWRHLRCTVGMDNLDQTVDERVLLGETRPKISLMQAYLDCIATAILRRNMQIWSRPRRIRFSQNSD